MAGRMTRFDRKQWSRDDGVTKSVLVLLSSVTLRHVMSSLTISKGQRSSMDATAVTLLCISVSCHQSSWHDLMRTKATMQSARAQ